MGIVYIGVLIALVFKEKQNEIFLKRLSCFKKGDKDVSGKNFIVVLLHVLRFAFAGRPIMGRGGGK